VVFRDAAWKKTPQGEEVLAIRGKFSKQCFFRETLPTDRDSPISFIVVDSKTYKFGDSRAENSLASFNNPQIARRLSANFDNLYARSHTIG
jgi:hypothetical protein